MQKAGLILLSAVCGHAAVADVTYRVDAGAGYSDNIERVATNPMDEKIGKAGLELSWLRNTQHLNADVHLDGDYLHYVDDTFEDEFVGLANGTVELGIIPQRFTWLLQDSFGQAQSDPFAPATPETRENINYFTTGPDLVLNLGAANSVRFFGRYSLTNYEISPFDGDRVGGGVILARQLGGQNRIELQGVGEKVRFDDTPQSDFDRRDIFLKYIAHGARTELTAEGGYTLITLHDENEMSGPLARLDVTRTLSPASKLQLTLGTQFSDASGALRGAADGGAADIPTGVTSAPTPFENQYAALAWNFNRNRTGFALSASWNKDDYDQQVIVVVPGPALAQQDRTRMVYSATFSRRLTTALSASLFGSFIDEEFETQLTSEEFRVGGTLDWQFGRHVGLSLTAESNDRTTSDGFGEYREARGFLTIFYRSAEASDR